MADGTPRHAFYRFPGPHAGYFSNLLVQRNCAAVTGACLMTRADLFHALGGFTEELALNYSDIDYCLRVLGRGRRVVFRAYKLPSGFDIRDHQTRVEHFGRAFVASVTSDREDYDAAVRYVIDRFGKTSASARGRS